MTPPPRRHFQPRSIPNNVLHIRRFDERVIKVLVLRVERVVYLERAAGFRQIAGDLNTAVSSTDKEVTCAITVVNSLRIDRLGRAVESAVPGTRIGYDKLKRRWVTLIC